MLLSRSGLGAWSRANRALELVFKGLERRLEVRSGKESLRGQPRAVHTLDHLDLLL